MDLRTLGVRSDVVVVGRFDVPHARFGLTPHVHDARKLEICYLVSGQQQYVVGGKLYTLRGGDAIVIFPHDDHSTGDAPVEGGILYYMRICLPRSKHRFMNLRSPEAGVLHDALLRVNPRLFPGSPLMLSHLEAVFNLAGPARTDRVLAARLHHHLVGFLFEVVQCAASHAARGRSSWAEKILRYIESNIANRVNVAGMAAHMGLSPSSFQTRFKAEMGMPAANYVARRRIEAAKSMLADLRKSITHVAFDLGFPSAQYFATVFRRHTGISPGEYRAAGQRRRQG